MMAFRMYSSCAASVLVARLLVAALAGLAFPPTAVRADTYDGSEESTPLTIAFVWSDWAAEERTMRVRAEVPAGVVGPLELVSGIRRPDAPQGLRIVGPVRDLLEIIGPAHDLFLALEPGTRSFRLRSKDGRLWRIDLPAVAVEGVSVVAQSPDADDHSAHGPTLHLATQNVMPGFRIFVSVQTDGDRDTFLSQRWSESEVTEDNLHARLLHWRHRDKRLEVQLLTENAVWLDDMCSYLLTVVNADGSRSHSIGISLFRDGSVRAAGRPFRARPAPIHRLGQVPSLEILTAADAAKQALEAGFAPVLVDLNTWREIPLNAAADEIVRSQGLRPFSRAREGEWLLLGIRRTAPDGFASEHVRRAAAQGAVPLEPPVPIDVGDDFGFVQLNPSPMGAHLAWRANPRQDDAFDRGNAWLPERDPGDVDALDSPLPDDIQLPIDPTPGTPFDDHAWWHPDSDDLPDSFSDDADTLSVNPDPGIPILPDQPPEITLGAAVLRIIVAALAASGVEPAGIVGEAIQHIVEQFEKNVADSLKARDPDAVPVGQIIAAVAQILQVALDDAHRDRAIADWHDRFGDQPSFALIDRNRNGLATDDIAVWCLQWLQQEGLYDPRNHIAVIPGDSGTGTAIVTHSAESGKWLEDLLELLLRRPEMDGKQPIDPETPGDDQIADQPDDSIPEGPAEEIAYTLPDGLRVPDVLGMRAGEALRILKEYRLKATYRKGSLAQDLVTVQSPEAGWQPFAEAVQLTLERPVPDVTGMDLGDAIAQLKKWQLRWRHGEDKAFMVDVVLSQDPPPHSDARPSTINPDEAVQLQIAVKVPDVTDRLFPDALATLKKWDLQAGGTQGGFQQDKVLRQTPLPHSDNAPSYLPHGGTVELLLGVKVPDVVRLKMPDARERLERWDLIPKYGEAFSQDIVLRQHPEGGLYVPHKSEIHITPGVKVPQVTGRPLSDARETLTKWNLSPQVPNHLARGLDTVRGQSPTPTETVIVQHGHVRRQQTRDRYVPHGSTVTLDPVLARVPQLTGRTIGDARDILNREDFRSTHHSVLIATDRVTNQRPSAGSEYARGQQVHIGAEVRVPDVLDQSVRNAEAAVLRSPGDLRPQFTVHPNANDVVIGQRPSAGQFVNPRTTIVLTPGIPLPNVVGMELDQAGNRLRQAGLDYRVRTVTRETEVEGQVGRRMVERQHPSPAGGFLGIGRVAAVPHGTTIDLTVVQFVVEMVTVPNVVGMEANWDGDLYGPAGDALRRAGFRYESQLTEATHKRQDDTIARQHPPGGTRVPAKNRPVVRVWVYVLPR